MIKISSILIGVKDLKRVRPFYEKVFGFSFEEFRPPFACTTFGGIEFDIEENAGYRTPDWAEKNIGGRKREGKSSNFPRSSPGAGILRSYRILMATNLLSKKRIHNQHINL